MPALEIITPEQWVELSALHDLKNLAITKALEDLYSNTTIYDRLDNLIALYEACENHKPRNRRVEAIQEQAEKFIEIIGNSDDIENTIQMRKDMRETWPNYLPNTTLEHIRPFKAEQTREEKIQQRLADHFKAVNKQLLDVNAQDKVHDKLARVKMLSPLEKEAYRIMPSSGKLWQLKQPEDKHTPLSIDPFDTSDMNAHNNKQGYAIFIVSPQGEIFSGSSEMDKFHHSSFQSGGFVSYGGTLQVNEGKLDYIDDYSGHYTPKVTQFFNVLKELKSRGLVHPETEISRKFDESSGLKIGSSPLNTRGFLGLPPLVQKPKTPEIIDHYQIIQEFLFKPDIAGENFANPLWRQYAVVMTEYLKQQLEQGDNELLSNHYAEAKSMNKDLGIEENFATNNPDKYQEYKSNFIEFITANKGLYDDLGGNNDWLTSDKPELTKGQSLQ